MTNFRRAGLAPALAVAALALTGCGGEARSPGLPAAGSPDAAISESPTVESAVMSCETIATEHAAITQSLQRLGVSDAAEDLKRREAALAQLAAEKRCATF